MRHIEDDIQKSCIKWFDYQYPKYSKNLFHPANGGFRNTIEASKFKTMGVRAGVSDLIFLKPNRFYHGLCIEMKTSKGKQQPTQEEFQKAVEEQGYKYIICRSLDDFMNELNRYLGDI